MSQSQHPAYRRWHATRGDGTLCVISTFYESIIRTMSGGVGPDNYGDGDVVLPDYSYVFEVKAATSTNAFPIRADQLAEHERRLREEFMFAGASYFYCFFGYSAMQSRRLVTHGSTRRSLIHTAVKEGRGYEFLAERTRDVWILPLSLVRVLYDELREAKPRNGKPLFPPTQDKEPSFGARVYRHDLRNFAQRSPVHYGYAQVTHQPKQPKKDGEVVADPVSYTTRFRVTYFDSAEVHLPHLMGLTWNKRAA